MQLYLLLIIVFFVKEDTAYRIKRSGAGSGYSAEYSGIEGSAAIPVNSIEEYTNSGEEAVINAVAPSQSPSNVIFSMINNQQAAADIFGQQAAAAFQQFDENSGAQPAVVQPAGNGLGSGSGQVPITGSTSASTAFNPFGAPITTTASNPFGFPITTTISNPFFVPTTTTANNGAFVPTTTTVYNGVFAPTTTTANYGFFAPTTTTAGPAFFPTTITANLG
ncbi:unnamed protein product [Bursaphelenchus xylophilus]|uniref:(pine wood nematode) hypothetical protein n=1 Tax=Bursaphelenchus xylophilus TaxID=6326 RepID=A0A1I7RPA2_BURXY|nr:unnamed protein product [Bursaphelenchus xylophilus]CAG9095672.1 unnamed protein product [Bursaphelenchus xylophilus]